MTVPERSNPLAACWRLAWQVLVFGVLGGFVLGYLAVAVVGHLLSIERATVFAPLGGYMGSVMASMLAFNWAVARRPQEREPTNESHSSADPIAGEGYLE